MPMATSFTITVSRYRTWQTWKNRHSATVEHVSETLEDITLSVSSGEGGSGNTQTIDVAVEFIAQADDIISMNPTATFGDESGEVAINLNMNLDDVDGSETVSFTLTGNGDTLRTVWSLRWMVWLTAM